MPEYLAPGVYVEETSFRAKSIEGVGTSTTAFVGLSRRGPIGGVPELLTSLPDFERTYGSLTNLSLTGSTDQLNYLAHAVRAYFDNGGSRLYVMRVHSGAASATGSIRTDADPLEAVTVNARFPGAAYNGRFTLRETLRPATTIRVADAAPFGSVLRVTTGTTAAPVNTLYVKRPTGWFDSADAAFALTDGMNAQLVTLSAEFTDADEYTQVWDDLGLAGAHPRFIGTVLAATPSNRADALQNSISVTVGANATPFELQTAIAALTAVPGDTEGRRQLTLAGGTDGAAPATAGAETTAGSHAEALAILSGIEDISIVASPGSSAYSASAQAVHNALISHAERRRAYRIAVLDTPPSLTPGGARDVRGRLDSKYAALYYPWVVVSNPLARPGRNDPREIALPPSGFVCGIYARNDVQRGVHKAPANEVVRGALRFDLEVNFAQQEMLNPIGVNCLRFLSGRGNRLWGARLISSDPEWKYVSDRRYFNYLEASIDRSTQWAVFEPNGERLWANIRETIAGFLYNEWRSGALLGTSPEEAFFVRCDRSTMTQNDLDNGRLICLIGVAIIKPAEFVIFRIGQKTADARE